MTEVRNYYVCEHCGYIVADGNVCSCVEIKEYQMQYKGIDLDDNSTSPSKC